MNYSFFDYIKYFFVPVPKNTNITVLLNKLLKNKVFDKI